jgi:hypothetical protein
VKQKNGTIPEMAFSLVDMTKSLTGMKQVKRMADVFSKAEKVIVWLGTPGHDADLALRYLDWLASRVNGDQAQGEVSTTFAWENEPSLADPQSKLRINSSVLLYAICLLFERPWFERLWIQQEIRPARRGVVMCGNEVISWQALCHAVFYIYTKGLTNPGSLNFEKRTYLYNLR